MARLFPPTDPPPRPQRVEPVAPAVLAARVDAELLRPADVEVTGITLRAQQVRPGDLFAALPGARAHGADFAGQALERGAVAVLTDADGAGRLTAPDVPVLVHPDPRGVLGNLSSFIYGEPSRGLRIIGITGTSGKTTTAYLVEAGLAAAGRRTGLIGTVETRVGDERIDSAFTTPEAPDLQALFAMMRERGVTDVVMEVSSHALSLGRVAGTRFVVGAFTNLSQDHLDFHTDMEDYFAAKSLLFDGRADQEVVCVEDGWGARLVTPKTTTVGADGDWTATDVVSTPDGHQVFTVHGPGGSRESVRIPLPGAFNVSNALVAVGCLTSVGVGLTEAAAGLAGVLVPGRMERVDAGQDFVAVVDYSHKPGAVTAVLAAARERTDGRVIIVVGCGGDRDVAKRPVMGEVAARGSDLLIITDDNPRDEDPAAIRAAMREGALAVPRGERGEVCEIGNRREAIAEAVNRARAGDMVIIAGKGHEPGQEVHGEKLPFSDRVETRAAILDRTGRGS